MEYIYGNTSSLNWRQAGIDQDYQMLLRGAGGTTEEDLNGDEP